MSEWSFILCVCVCVCVCVTFLQKNSFKKPLKTGYLVKQGGVRKNWLRRFFVVRPDFKIEYYEDEEVSSVQSVTCVSPLTLY